MPVVAACPQQQTGQAEKASYASETITGTHTNDPRE